MSKSKDLMKCFGNRQAIEAAVVYSLYNDCSLFDQYNLDDNDFLSKEGKLLFTLGKLISYKGVNSIDETTLRVELSHHPDLEAELNEYGGVRSVISELKYVDSNNMDLYYDKLMKNNYLMALNKNGLDVTRYADQFNEMDYTQVQDFIEYKLLNIANKNNNVYRGVKETSLEITDSMLNTLENGEAIDTISYGEYCPLLNELTIGITIPDLHILSACTGVGKSTFVFSNIIYPALKQGEEVVLISNELSYMRYVMMMLPIVAVREFNYWKLTRDKLLKGVRNEEDKEVMIKAANWINDNMKHRLHIVEYTSGKIEVAAKAMRKYSKLGCRLAVFDTLKPENSVGQAWAELQEGIKTLTFCAAECGMALLTPFQIANQFKQVRNPHIGMLSECKDLPKVATTHLMMRDLQKDEYTGEKFDVCAYRTHYNKETEKMDIEPITLDKNKDYIVVTIDKNRNGGKTKNIIYQFMGHLAIYKEIGYCNPKPDPQYKR